MNFKPIFGLLFFLVLAYPGLLQAQERQSKGSGGWQGGTLLLEFGQGSYSPLEAEAFAFGPSVQFNSDHALGKVRKAPFLDRISVSTLRFNSQSVYLPDPELGPNAEASTPMAVNVWGFLAGWGLGLQSEPREVAPGFYFNLMFSLDLLYLNGTLYDTKHHESQDCSNAETTADIQRHCESFQLNHAYIARKYNLRWGYEKDDWFLFLEVANLANLTGAEKIKMILYALQGGYLF